MKTVLTVLATLSLLTTMSSHAESVIKVDVRESGNECTDCLYVTVTSKTDNILIEKIDVNRGRCPQLKKGNVVFRGVTVEGWWPNKDKFSPRKMQFAESVTWRFGNTLMQSGFSCHFIEAKVYTNKGVFTFS